VSDKKIIVYGNGNCSVVKAVLDFHGVSRKPILVYEGGFAEWTEKNAKIEAVEGV
jgi:3-mercaptopyruvate sulfurtransferase SseA